MAPLSTGAAGAKMVATDIFGEVRNAPIMDKFEFVKEDTVEEYGAKVILFRHKKTGAEVMSVSVPDENKVFGITFRTVRTHFSIQLFGLLTWFVADWLRT